MTPVHVLWPREAGKRVLTSATVDEPIPSDNNNQFNQRRSMNFLSKLLQAIAFVPGIVTSIEGLLSHRSGSDKKDAVMSFLQTALSMTDAVANKEIVDESKFRDGLTQIINGTVECLNASVWAKAQGSQASTANTTSAPAQ
jgi:hypothetical protein